MLETFPIVDTSVIPKDATIHTWCPLSGRRMFEMYYSEDKEFLMKPFFQSYKFISPINISLAEEEIENTSPLVLVRTAMNFLSKIITEDPVPAFLVKTLEETKSHYFCGTILVHFLIGAALLPSCPTGIFSFSVLFDAPGLEIDLQTITGSNRCIYTKDKTSPEDCLVFARARGMNRPFKVIVISTEHKEVSTSLPIILLVDEGTMLDQKLEKMASLIVTRGKPQYNPFGVATPLKQIIRSSIRAYPDALKRLHETNARNPENVFVGYDDRSLGILGPGSVTYWTLSKKPIISLVIYWDKNCPLQVQQIIAMVATKYVIIIID